jgi:hypothetical protein
MGTAGERHGMCESALTVSSTYRNGVDNIICDVSIQLRKMPSVLLLLLIQLNSCSDTHTHTHTHSTYGASPTTAHWLVLFSAVIARYTPRGLRAETCGVTKDGPYN